MQIDAFNKAMDTIFVTAKLMHPYDPSRAMAHRGKIDELEAERIKQSKQLIKAQNHILELEQKGEKLLREGKFEEIEKLKILFMENLSKLSEENREQLRLVAEAQEKQRSEHKEAMKLLIDQCD